ncbi:hypothetical protein [Cupriavidus taiwanensis]|uniref:hypothetical protein n=1 Tax=Cupriavidus taiwanensis TaxID=164546 RepID=UPI003B634F57
MPVAAVMAGGSFSVSSASRIASCGNSRGLMITVLNSVSLFVKTVDAVHSLPVPDVVGIAKIGSGALGILS